MMLERWDPFRELRRTEANLNRLWRGRGYGASANGAERWVPPFDVVEKGDDIVIEAAIPGVKPEDINVTIEDGVLTVAGETHAETEETRGSYLVKERRTGKFHRALRLPRTVDTEKAETSYEDGVLAITLPRAEDKKAKRLPVNAGK